MDQTNEEQSADEQQRTNLGFVIVNWGWREGSGVQGGEKVSKFEVWFAFHGNNIPNLESKNRFDVYILA